MGVQECAPEAGPDNAAWLRMDTLSLHRVSAGAMEDARQDLAGNQGTSIDQKIRSRLAGRRKVLDQLWCKLILLMSVICL